MRFHSKLRGVVEVLQLTPAAGSKDRAKRTRARPAIRESISIDFGNRVALFYFDDSDARALVWKRTKAKDDEAAGAADALTVGEEIGKRELEFDALAQRRWS